MIRVATRLGCTANWVVLQIGLYLLNLHSPAASANLPALVNHAYLPTYLFLFVSVNWQSCLSIYLSFSCW